MHEHETQSDKSAPKAVIGRVGLYLRQLEVFRQGGKTTVSSSLLGQSLNLSDAQVRKDLAYFGPFGSPGIGYRIEDLINDLRDILGINRAWPTALIGVGNLGLALLKYRGFQKNGFFYSALFDKSPRIIGSEVEGHPVLELNRFPDIAKSKGIRLAVICVPAEEAQSVASFIVHHGVLGILNFAPVALTVPPEVEVVDVDLSIHLERLAYHVKQATKSLEDTDQSIKNPT